tara:strand:- start:20 stop:1237 length:1218 start_codon:yes stop_codon:yes gene_type:complete
MSDYSLLSIKLTDSLDKKTKKQNGIYFTPPKTVEMILNKLSSYFSSFKNILEPSCGSGEFISSLVKISDSVKIDGIEFNSKIYDSIKSLFPDNVTIKNTDFINHECNKKYNLIIGNPPYYVMKKNCVDKKYYQYFTGRPNIFILFIIKCLSLLETDGILSFVLPKSFLNCSYYDKTRKLINKNFQILDIIQCNDKYIETQQDTIVLIIKNVSKKKSIDNNRWILKISEFIIFGTCDKIQQLNKIYLNSTNLKNYGFKVIVGNVVWNQCKSILTTDSSKTTLIYSSDIKTNKFKMVNYKNPEKKNWIEKRGIKKPLLLVNRGYGVGKYFFNYCLITGEFEYLVENHLICIVPIKSISDEELLIKYNKIIESFKNPKTLEFIKMYFGNNAINTVELAEILPIFIDCK